MHIRSFCDILIKFVRSLLQCISNRQSLLWWFSPTERGRPAVGVNAAYMCECVCWLYYLSVWCMCGYECDRVAYEVCECEYVCLCVCVRERLILYVCVSECEYVCIHMCVWVWVRVGVDVGRYEWVGTVIDDYLSSAADTCLMHDVRPCLHSTPHTHIHSKVGDQVSLSIIRLVVLNSCPITTYNVIWLFVIIAAQVPHYTCRTLVSLGWLHTLVG